MRLFRKKDTPLQFDIVNEKWRTSFSMFQEHRFVPENADGYHSDIDHGRLMLEIRRKNMFAWTDNPLYRYDNFLLEAELGIDPENGYSSAGVLFRKIEDLSFYYFIVSNRGYFRCDLVLNNTPSVLIDWTRCPGFSSERFKISVSADGSRLSFYLNDRWLGNISDESIDAGGLAFAAQNYDETERAGFSLFSIAVESRPAELEKKREKSLPKNVPVESRLTFAESRMRNGQYAAALIEIKKALRDESPGAEALMMAADCCINLELYDEAVVFFDRIPNEDRGELYWLRRASLMYLTNDMIRLRDLLLEKSDLLGSNPVAANLLGNAEFSLGNWHKASDSYMAAFKLDNAAGYAFNAARAYEKTGNRELAAAMYGDAARAYFREGKYDELSGILPFLEALDPADNETKILRAKLLFQDGRLDEANRIFSGLIKAETGDSAVYYLNALVEAKNDKPKKAEKSFRRAIELEPDYYLYYFKYAEHLFMIKGNYRKMLEKALELAPDDPWVLNLAGLASMEDGGFPAAVEFFSKAYKAAPAEDEILVNYSEALFLSGDSGTALSLLDRDSAGVLNQRGNIYARLNDYQSALRDYESALAADNTRTDVILNLAAACIETDAFSRAEELLIRIVENDENAQAYNLLGNMAMLKGEYSRAEAAYSRAVAISPDYIDAVCNLAEFYIARDRLNDADIVLGNLSSDNPGARYEKLRLSVFKRRMNVFNCASCGEEWIVPRKISAQPVLKLVGEPPDNMPAGKCSSCGKVYCIGCTREHLKDGRLVCLSCGAPLKLSEDWIRYLYQEQTH